MPGACFADRLGQFVELTPSERASLSRLEERERSLKRGAVLQRENDRSGELFILNRGTMMSYVLLNDGSRQILRFLFPGDMVGVSALAFREAPETLAALSDCTVCPFDRAAMARLIEEHPRLAALIMVNDQIERVILTDRLAALGRTSAKARVAAVLLEMRDRVAPASREGDRSFVLGLTQEEIGDATGLTAVHVNRMLRQLEDEALIRREAGRLTILAPDRLARAANYVNRFEAMSLGWLPPAR